MPSLMIALLLSGVAPTDYWVDISHGDNSFEGSEERPFKNLFHALSVATDGDRVWVRPGNYALFTGELFPLEVPAGVSVISTDGPEGTWVIGDGVHDVFRCLDAVESGTTVIEGLTIRSGSTGVRSSGGSSRVTLVNNTISANRSNGFSLGTEWGHVEALYNRVEQNMDHGGGIGSLRSDGPHAISRGNRFIGNRFGLRMSCRWEDGVLSENDVFSENESFGVQVGNSVDNTMSAVLRNGTITRNGYGGVSVSSGYSCFYIPHAGWFCTYFYGRLKIQDSLICDNGSYGVIEVSDLRIAIGTLESCIVWGNGFDNTGFENTNSLIGTSDTPLGPGSISADPGFVDRENGDYRLRPDSPCIDHHPVSSESLDIDGELVPFDGDGDGIALKDIGPDEFHTFVFAGQRPVQDKPFHFEIAADPSDEGHLALVLISESRAKAGGIPLPGDPRTVDLEPDGYFSLGLSILPLLTARIKDRRAQTPQMILPSEAFSLYGELFFAAVTIDLESGSFASVTPSHRLPLLRFGR